MNDMRKMNNSDVDFDTLSEHNQKMDAQIRDGDVHVLNPDGTLGRRVVDLEDAMSCHMSSWYEDDEAGIVWKYLDEVVFSDMKNLHVTTGSVPDQSFREDAFNKAMKKLDGRKSLRSYMSEEQIKRLEEFDEPFGALCGVKK